MRCWNPNHKQACDIPRLRALQVLSPKNIARRKKASLPENDEAYIVECKTKVVARTITAMESPAPRARRASVPGSHSADRRTSGAHGRGLHLSHRARRSATVPYRWSSVEKAACSGGRFSEHGVFVVSFFPRRSRQRSAADKSRAIRSWRSHLFRHDIRQILLHLGDACQRYSARP